MKKREIKISYHKKPESLSLNDWQRELRRQFVADKLSSFIITRLDGEHPVFTDYLVKNPVSGGNYKVALRSRALGQNFCSCLDFKTNLLGTCKHIEAVLQQILKNKKIAKLLNDEFKPSYSSLYLKYGKTREIMLRIGSNSKDMFLQLAPEYFDNSYRLLPDAFDRIDQFLERAVKISPDFRCYPDALDYIIKMRSDRRREKTICQKIGDAKSEYFNRLLKTALYPYQKEGVLFAVRKGRSLIADDMGLGKTLQAIGAAELFKKEFGIHNVLIICPTSLKYQWKSEIEKFAGSTVLVIEGDVFSRKKQYMADSFYKIISYNVVGADIENIKKMRPDFVVLDEAQRIKNWKTKTANQVKKIESTYALVLTGTPIENKLEELYSIIQFIDPFKLGPLYNFLEEHQIRDAHGKIIGYKELNQIHTLLADVVLRRTKKQVLAQLPNRTDKHLFVPLTEEQAAIHTEYAEGVVRLVAKWKRFGFLDEKDRQRLLLCLNCMRMVSDSTYILDQETRFDTKITELMSILENALVSEVDKVVIFSQWERMTRLVGRELIKAQISFSYLHGGVPSNKRKELLDNFHADPKCRVFLSTDAGGVGLNLQCAAFLINLDIPWNPAVLEQRIGRIHRHGQKHNINIINLISRQSIEERMLEVLKFKSSLFAGVLDHGENQIFMEGGKFKQFMSSVEQVAATPLSTHPPVTKEEFVQEPLLVESASSPVAEFFAASETFFTSLAKTFSDKEAPKKIVSSLIEKDPATGKKFLKIPVENEEVVSRAISAFTDFLSVLKKPDKL